MEIVALMSTTSEDAANTLPPTLSTTQAAAELAVSDGTIRRWAADGLLEAEWVGKRLRIPPAALKSMRRPARIDAGE